MTVEVHKRAIKAFLTIMASILTIVFVVVMASKFMGMGAFFIIASMILLYFGLYMKFREDLEQEPCVEKFIYNEEDRDLFLNLVDRHSVVEQNKTKLID